jgi:hypothetical protein
MTQIILRAGLSAFAAVGFLIRHRGGVVPIVVVALVGFVFAPRRMVEATLAAAIIGTAITVATLLNDSF